MPLPPNYLLRSATAKDAEIIAAQRGQMFSDMDRLSAWQIQENQPIWIEWLREALVKGEYVGWLVEHQSGKVQNSTGSSKVVGGAGMMFRPQMPSAQDPAAISGYILNISVDLAHRRKGLAEILTRAALAEAGARGICTVGLMASPMGQRMYQRLGFQQSPNPYLVLRLESGSEMKAD